MKNWLIPLLVLACALVCACGSSSDSSSPTVPGQTAASETQTLPPISTIRIPNLVTDHSKSPFSIVVSLPIFVDIVKQITGDQAVVTPLIPVGADPQTYQPTPDQADLVAKADLIFYNGLGEEPPTASFIQAHAQGLTTVIDFARNVPSPSVTQPPNAPIYAKQVGDDPHLFLDPKLIPVYPETVADEMVIKDGANQAYYNARFAAYNVQLMSLNTEIAQKMDALPAQSKASLVTYHNSLIWFAKRYGLAVAGTVVDNGSGLSQVVSTAKPVALFTETGYDTSALDSLAQSAGIKTCNLYTDTIADAGMTYIQMMEYDADTIASCLG